MNEIIISFACFYFVAKRFLEGKPDHLRHHHHPNPLANIKQKYPEMISEIML